MLFGFCELPFQLLDFLLKFIHDELLVASRVPTQLFKHSFIAFLLRMQFLFGFFIELALHLLEVFRGFLFELIEFILQFFEGRTQILNDLVTRGLSLTQLLLEICDLFL